MSGPMYGQMGGNGGVLLRNRNDVWFSAKIQN